MTKRLAFGKSLKVLFKTDFDLKRTHKSWRKMRDRCKYKFHHKYHRYGGRGISVCKEWDDFSVFLKDMGLRPKGHTINRIDNNGDYCPENCRWATPKEQAINRGGKRRLTYNGETKCAIEWARCVGLRPVTLYARLNNGWSVEKALSTPVNPKHSRPKIRLKTID